MRNKLCRAICCAVVFASFASIACANEVVVKRDIKNEVFKIEGYTEDKAEGIPVSVNIYRIGKNMEDLFLENPFDVMAFHDQTVTDKDGKFIFYATPEGTSGVYSGYIKAGHDDICKINLNVLNLSENKIAIGELNQVEDEAEMKTFIDENREKLGFDILVFDDVDKLLVAEMLIDEKEKSGDFDPEDPEKVIATFNQIVLAQALNESDSDNKVIENVAIYKDMISCLQDKDSKVYEWYFKMIEQNTENEKSMTKRMYNHSISSCEELQSVFSEALVLQIVKNPDGYGNVKELMNDFKEEIGIETSISDEDSVYKKIAGRDFSNFDELFEAYEDATRKKNDKDPYKPSSGGGGSSSNKSNIVTTPPVVAVPIEVPAFSDLDAVPWAKQAIEGLAKKEIVSGKTENMFYPDDFIKREECVKILVNLFGFTDTNNSLRFKDVAEDDWYFKYVRAAYQNGIVNGMEEDLFGAGENITRQDLSVMVVNSLNKKGIELSLINSKKNFTDDADISDYAKDAVSILQQANIINGFPDNTFKPKEKTTRAEAAVILYSVLSYVQ